MPELFDALVIGAGPAGLAAAASLRERGLDAAILEKDDSVGAVWRRHYDRLHLHTDRRHSELPGLPMPKAYGRYPSRLDVIDYLERYATRFALQPSFGTQVRSLYRFGSLWRAEAGDRTFDAPAVVVATGSADFPYLPSWPGLETFGGEVLHSSAYRIPERFHGQRVLVVGFGNSGGEIALDLAEADVDVAISVRGPVSVLPRELLGIPILTWAIAQQRLPTRVVDTLNAPLLRLAVGSIEKLGLKRPAKGPRRMVEEDGRIPLLDIGALAMIRAGRIAVRPDIEAISAETVAFADGRVEPFDTIILATGFRPDLRALLPDVNGVLSDSGKPLVSGRRTREPGLYFCGAIPSATGQFREIGIEARRIADAIAEDRSSLH
jgi:cation diffusion facilitator CzcD-associated flavoprotein CzcO